MWNRTWLEMDKKLCNNRNIKAYGAVPNTNPVTYQVTSQTTWATFPVVTLSINYNIKYLENTKQGFKRKMEQI